MEERDFFDERQEKKPASLNCPHCHQSAEYDVTWVVRTKKRQLPGRADERDREVRFQRQQSIARQHRDPIPGRNTGLLQSRAERVNAPLHLGVGEAPVAINFSRAVAVCDGVAGKKLQRSKGRYHKDRLTW